MDDIKQIYYYQPTCESEARARDFWLFCFFANGINPKDIALLRYKNIDGEFIVFERAKIENATRGNSIPISIYINEDIAAIIERWGNKDKDPENFIFPILEHDITPLRQYELIELFIRSINDWMGKVCENLDIDRKATTYVARHSFATVLKRSGASTEFIQEALGHANKKTTENYLDSFEKEVKKEFASKLLAFKEKPIDQEQASLPTDNRFVYTIRPSGV